MKQKIEMNSARDWRPLYETKCDCKVCRKLQRTFELSTLNNPEYGIDLDGLYKVSQWAKPCTVNVSPNVDLFDNDIDLGEIEEVFGMMEDCPQHTYVIKTKNPERVLELQHKFEWPENTWLGAIVEDRWAIPRLEDLKKCIAKNKFLALEPLVGPLPKLSLKGIDWVSVSGEIGKCRRELNPNWLQPIFQACIKANVRFTIEHGGGDTLKSAYEDMHARLWSTEKINFDGMQDQYNQPDGPNSGVS